MAKLRNNLAVCALCGAKTHTYRVTRAWVCGPCLGVCVAVTMDRLAGALLAEQERVRADDG